MTEPTPSPPARQRGTAAPRLLEGRRIRGANVHHHASVFVQRIELGVLDGLTTSDVGPDFGSRFVARFTGLQSLRQWPSLPADVITKLEGNREVPLVEVLLHAIVAVERSVACIMQRLDTLEFARIVHSEPAPGAVGLVWESPSATTSRAAVKVAFAGLVELLSVDRGGRETDPARDFATGWAALQRRALRRQWAPTTAVLALAAKRRGIPHEVLAGSYVRLGEGVQQQVVSESSLGVDPRLDRAAVPDVRTPPPRWKYGRQRLHRILVLGGRVVSAIRIERGAVPVDVTDQMHDDTRHAAVVAVAERGWPHAVVDFRTANISRSPKRGRGRVTRIDPWPELFPHALPSLGHSVDVGNAALDMVFPKQATGRIPAALVVGERGTMSQARWLDRYLRKARAGVGLALRDRTTIEGRMVDHTLLGRDGGREFLLSDPRVAAVISAVSPRKILKRGLRCHHCNVIAFLDPEPGSDAASYRAALEVGLAAATDAIVISPDNPHVEFVLGRVEPTRVLLAAMRRKHPVVSRHLAANGAVVLPAPGRTIETIELRWSGRTVATVAVASLRRSKREPSERALRKAITTAALAFGIAPALVGSPAEQAVAVSPDPADRRGADATSERHPHAAEWHGTRRASPPGGSYPSADGDQGGPYRNRR